MKKYNTYLNIINILAIIEIITLKLSLNVFISLYIYEIFMIIFSLLCLVNVILNMINGVANFKNKKEAIVSVLVGLLIAISLIVNQKIVLIITGVIAGIFSIISIIISKQNNKEERNKIITGFLVSYLVLQILVFIIPIIMNVINLNNLKKALPIIETQITVKTDVKEENDEYVFYLKNGKEYKRVKFDEMYINQNNNELYGILLNGNRLEIGIARSKNRVIIINSQGEEIFYLCNIFENYKEVAEKFLNYVGKVNKYGITVAN